MKRIQLITGLFCLSIALVQCTPKKATTSTVSDADKVAEIKKNFSDDDMKEGMTLWQGKCGDCHKLPKPEEYKVAKMERVLPRMFKRSKFDDVQSAKVRAYILAHAKVD